MLIHPTSPTVWKSSHPFYFVFKALKKASGGGGRGIILNTERYSELICVPSRGWVYLGGVKPLRKFPQDPIKSTVIFPKSYAQHALLPTARPLWDLQKRGGPRASWAPCTPTPHPLCLPRCTHNCSLQRRSLALLKVRLRHGVFMRGENNADFKSECQETTQSPGRLQRARAEKGFYPGGNPRIYACSQMPHNRFARTSILKVKTDLGKAF